MKPETDFTAKHLNQLVGKTIRNIITDNGGYWGLVLSDKTTVWILCDPEGNGPGWLDIEKQ